MTSLRVIHESWGEGRILPSTELFDDEGNVYVDIMFDHGIEHEVLVDEGLADVIRGGAKLAGRAVAAPGRAVRAVKGAVDRATTATKSAVNRATTATKQFGQSVGAAYQSGKTAHIKPSAPAPASTRDVVGGKQASVSYGGLVGKSAGSLVPSAPAAKAPRKKASAATAAPAPETTNAGPGVVRSGKKKVTAPEAPVKKAPSNPPKKAASRSGASSAPAATPTAKPTSSVTFSSPKRSRAPIAASYEYDDEDNYIEEGYVYNGESLYEAAVRVVKPGTAKGIDKTAQPRGYKGGRGLEQDDLQKAPRKGAGRPTVEDEDTARRSPIHQISGIADRNIDVENNYMDRDGKKHTLTQKDAKRIMHHYRHVMKNGEERSALMRAVDADPHHKLRASYVNKEEVEQPRMSAYSSDSRSFALEHSIRNIISEGRNLRKEAMLSKYGLLEKAESLGERVSTATSIKKIYHANFDENGRSAIVKYNPQTDRHEVDHMVYGKVKKTTTHDSKSDAIDAAERAMTAIKEDYEYISEGHNFDSTSKDYHEWADSEEAAQDSARSLHPDAKKHRDHADQLRRALVKKHGTESMRHFKNAFRSESMGNIDHHLDAAYQASNQT